MRAVRVVPSNGIDIAYETFGDVSDVPVLLVMGLGGQMVAWDDEFCALLAGCGHYVIRFDNRDIGLSTHLDQAASGKPVSAFLGKRPAYLIADMAQDAAGLIEQLDVGSVHVVGVSMGGCISQALTLAHPEQVRSLTSMSSSTGSRRVGHPRLDVVATLLLRKPGKNRDEAIALSESMFRRIGSPGYQFDAERLRRTAGLAYDRRYDPAGVGRQFAAILGSPDRTAALADVAVPTLVMHGEADPLIGVSGGRATAAAVPNSRLVTFPGMGHDIPEPLWPRFVDEISDIVEAGEDRRAAA